MRRIDLNADVGESTDPGRLALEAALLPFVTSVNIACGLHGGDAQVMRRMARAAHVQGAAVGAHPGFPDREGQGRRELRLTGAEIERTVAAQVAAMAEAAAWEGAALTHVKPHGALYNLAARDREVALAVARGAAAVDARLIFVGLAGSAAIEAGQAAGLAVAEEAFADRAYLDHGALAPRHEAGALLTDEQAVVTQALSLVREGVVRSRGGRPVPLRADTLCLHGDTPGAGRLAAAVRRALEQAGICVKPLR